MATREEVTRLGRAFLASTIWLLQTIRDWAAARKVTAAQLHSLSASKKYHTAHVNIIYFVFSRFHSKRHLSDSDVTRSRILRLGVHRFLPRHQHDVTGPNEHLVGHVFHDVTHFSGISLHGGRVFRHFMGGFLVVLRLKILLPPLPTLSKHWLRFAFILRHQLNTIFHRAIGICMHVCLPQVIRFQQSTFLWLASTRF